jgi:hypothetical protein
MTRINVLMKKRKSIIIKFFYIRVLQPNIRHDTQLVDLIEIERSNIDNNSNSLDSNYGYCLSNQRRWERVVSNI